MKRIFFAALAVMCMFTSCNKEENSDNFATADATFSLSFTLPSDATKATPVTGFGIENVVSDITVYIYDNSGNAVTGNGSKITVNATNFDIAGTTYTLKEGVAVGTTSGTRKIYLAANVPTAFTAPATEGGLLVGKLNMTAAATSSQITMFSSINNKNIVSVAAGEPLPAGNKVTTTLERVTAKVVATATSMSVEQTYAHIPGFKMEYVIDTWGVANDAKTVFAVKNVNATTGELNAFNATKFANAVGQRVASPTWSNFTNLYIGDNIPARGLQGEATYAMIRTKATPTMVATAPTASSVAWETAGSLTDLWVVLTLDKKAYFCSSEANADAVKAVVGGEWYKYTGCYVYFTIIMNASNVGKIVRNEFIHLNVTGITNDVFGGSPGDPSNGGQTPVDPTDPTNPDNPNPIDPEEPITPKPANILFEVSVAPWTYDEASVTLK